MQCGRNRDACFFGEDDHAAYRHWLAETLTETGCALHAYVLMTNHVRLLLTLPTSKAVCRCIMALGRRYVQHVNKTYGRTRTLGDCGHKSSPVRDDAYLLTCQRYIELNPLRAGIVGEPAHYRRSSYRMNGLGQTVHASAVTFAETRTKTVSGAVQAGGGRVMVACHNLAVRR